MTSGELFYLSLGCLSLMCGFLAVIRVRVVAQTLP